MPKTKIQIIEDDASYALELEMVLTELGYDVMPVIEKPTEWTPADDDLPDLVLADIYFGGKPEGVQVVNKMRRRGIPVVLMTSSNDRKLYEYAKKEFPSGYIEKPLKPVSLNAIIESALSNYDDPGVVDKALEEWSRKQIVNKFLFVRHGKGLVKLVVSDISLIEADGNYCYLHENGRRYVVNKPLRRFKEILSGQGFLQINRSQLVNFNMVDQLSFAESEIIVAGETLAIGSSYREEVDSWLHRL
ncbi:LytR/AlgR family response regulator transcription factor [Neolewinella agarilytica]|uniref:Two component transcriptional regulator, LytTR family n=1 Tax=Neolewinella agarilytica TaxID=478744 RepID=A0A1H8ZU73_9BACT|nr:response regulator transcription factor [Neolewinella agarilytica]SEP67803.1 two component transcriptional regulator, LytTR family [Neolewinella agarilytica]